jgi:ribosomal protein L20A (L18A)
MKNVLRVMFVVSFAALLGASMIAQKAVAPPPKGADSGPSLAATMQFIQENMNNQDTVGWVETRSDLSAITFRDFYRISGVVADVASCTLHKIETTDIKIDVAEGSTYNDLSRHSVSTSTIHLRDIESIRVESLQDLGNRSFAEKAHPEITVTITPAEYTLTLVASKPVFNFHVSFTKGKQSPIESDQSYKMDTLRFRDEDTANRLAKAFTHAIELCGGGNKEPF